MEDHTSPSLSDQQIKHIQESYALAMRYYGIASEVIDDIQKTVDDAIDNNLD